MSGNDLGLLKLSAPIGTVAPAQLYAGSAELNSTLTIVGYGKTGTGLTGGIFRRDQTRRRQCDRSSPSFARRRLYTATTDGAIDRLVWDFDDPHGTVPNYFPGSTLPLEYMPAETTAARRFLSAGGQTMIAGVVSYGSYDGARRSSTYGDIAIATRVSRFTNWIEDTIANRWTSRRRRSPTAQWADGRLGRPTLRASTRPARAPWRSPPPRAQHKLLVRAGTVTLDLGGSV